MNTRRAFLSLVSATAASWALPLRAQERFSPFVASNPENARRMIELASLRPGDRVIDLGSGDGRIVFAAANAHPGVHGIGVDIDAELVQKANEAARAQGLAGRVRFLHQNAFDADLGEFDVIFMWLFPELMRLLRPKILTEAKAGARVVAQTWDLGSWPADAADDLGGTAPTIRKWIVPARVEGGWGWGLPLRERTPRFSAFIEQRMQQVEGTVRTGNRRELLQHMILRGDALQFSLRMTLPVTGYANLAFVGRVKADAIEGTVDAQLPRVGDDEGMDEFRLPWKASRTSTRGYFARTGTDIR